MLAGLSLTISAAIGVGVIVAIGSEHKNKNEEVKVSENVNSQFGDNPRPTLRSRPTVGVDSSQNIQVAPKRVGESISPDVLLERFSFLSNESESARLQLVGRGAYGRVVKAVETATGMKVAMKIVPQTAMSAVELLNEVEVLRRVRGHDNIIHLFQVLNCESETYLVTEICEGGELLDRLISRGPYDEEGASALVRNMVSAIDHIHKCGYVHLDIKPENIVFAENNGPFKKGHSADCRVVDFGTARKISEMHGNFTLSRFEDSGKIGTMAYWPPEALEGYFGSTGIESDPTACDMWALGIVLYIMLLGCHPFDINGEGTELAIAKRVLKNRVNFDIYGDELSLSKSAKDLLSRLLDPDPKTRITAEEVIEHPFIKKGMRKEASLNRLPSSWLHEGFKVSRSAEIDLHLENPDSRLKPFLTPESLDAFVRGLLIASATNGIKGARITSEGLFKKAFEAVQLDPREKEIHKRDIAALLRTTGEEHVKHFSTHPPTHAHATKPADDGLSFEEFVAILHRNDCVTRTLDSGSVIFSKGAEPQGIYILTKGQAQVELKGQPFATLGPGDILGETSVVHGVAARKATVRCTKPSEVVYVPKELFLRALAGSSALHTRVFQVSKLQQAERVYKLMQFLRPEAIQVKTFFKGETIYSQGDEADSMYFLRKGIVGANVTANTGYNEDSEPTLVRLSQRGPGDIFGLSALSVHGRRGSTMRCLTDVEVSVVSQKDISEIAQESDLMNFYLQTQAQWRKERAQERLVDMERGVTEPQLLPLILEAQEQESGATDSSSQDSSTGTRQTDTNREEPRRRSTRSRRSSVLRQPWEFVKSQLAKESKPDAGALEAYAKAVTEMKRESYLAGEAIFQKGEKPEKFYIVDSGTVGVEYISETGEVMTLATFGPGDHFGEQSLLENRPVYVTTVRCVTPAEILSMDREKFIEIVGDGETAFAKAVKSAMRQRQHLWVRNLLFLAKTQKKQQQFRIGDEGAHGELLAHEPRVAQSPVQVHRIILRKGERLFSRGDPSDAVYFIHQGELELTGAEDSDLLASGTRILSAGDTIGLESSRDQGQKFTATCRQNKTILSKIPRETLEVLIKDHEYVSTQHKRHAEKVAPLTELDRRTRSNRVQRKFSYSSVMQQAKRE